MSTHPHSTDVRPLSGSAKGSGRWRPFARHYLEMVIAMLVGMVVLHPIWSLGFDAAGWGGALDGDATMALVMATDMSVGMGAWMRFRGHGWRPIAEMCAAMYVPFAALLPPVWAGWMSGETMLMGGHLLMLPAMLAVMLCRPDEYSGCHDSHR